MIVTVCVGSSCHIKGARDIIARFNDFLTKEGLADKVELRGAFCMERCGKGINWKIDEETFSSSSVEDAVEVLRGRVHGLLKDKGT
ncbi:MAG TPA: (2Fe-2S) ferredoxin domain-containing protein [Sedimentisphaerales bacterium]|nr:(2Fe-2S) ferredoxin domain-containing protein [Sedimentisphaerales bacterium]